MALPLFVKILHKGISDLMHERKSKPSLGNRFCESIWLITNNVKFIISDWHDRLARFLRVGRYHFVYFVSERMTMSIFLLVSMTLGGDPGLPGSIGTFEAAIVLALTSQGYTFRVDSRCNSYSCQSGRFCNSFGSQFSHLKAPD